MKNEVQIMDIRMLLLGALVLLLGSCSYDDALHRTPHPTQGALVANTGYNGDYTLAVGALTTEAQQPVTVFTHLLNEGSYLLCAYNHPQGIGIAEGVATIGTRPDGTLLSLPGTLHSATRQIEPLPDDTLRLDLPLEQRTRRLTLRLTASTGTTENIATTRARITGIAPALYLGTLKLQGEPAAVCPDFVPATDCRLLTAELNLLGVFTDSRQEFTFDITLTDGTRQTLTLDMTEILAAFNTGTAPLTLDATLELTLSGAFRFNITDWKAGKEDAAEAW